ncbi:hypothetical protein JJQ59_09505 [Cupriavidus necator]|nr:hypothetical protein [Cupriavidus necator]QQX82729.1 hypothetical protein JJQ59_09505 [Cupriavidus necator]
MKLTLEELAAWQMALRRQRPVGKLCVNGWWTRPWRCGNRYTPRTT